MILRQVAIYYLMFFFIYGIVKNSNGTGKYTNDPNLPKYVVIQDSIALALLFIGWIVNLANVMNNVLATTTDFSKQWDLERVRINAGYLLKFNILVDAL